MNRYLLLVITYIHRPPGTTETQRAQRLKSDLYMDDMDEEKRAELRAKRLEARKEMERERRKAVKAAYKRLKDSKTKKSEVDIINDMNNSDKNVFNFPILFS